MKIYFKILFNPGNTFRRVIRIRRTKVLKRVTKFFRMSSCECFRYILEIKLAANISLLHISEWLVIYVFKQVFYPKIKRKSRCVLNFSARVVHAVCFQINFLIIWWPRGLRVCVVAFSLHKPFQWFPPSRLVATLTLKRWAIIERVANCLLLRRTTWHFIMLPIPVLPNFY